MPRTSARPAAVRIKRRDRVCHPRPKFMSGASLIDVQGTAASLELTVKTHALNFEHKMRLFSKQKAILFLKRFSNNNGRPIIKFYPTVWMACQCAAGGFISMMCPIVWLIVLMNLLKLLILIECFNADSVQCQWWNAAKSVSIHSRLSLLLSNSVTPNLTVALAVALAQQTTDLTSCQPYEIQSM